MHVYLQAYAYVYTNVCAHVYIPHVPSLSLMSILMSHVYTHAYACSYTHIYNNHGMS